MKPFKSLFAIVLMAVCIVSCDKEPDATIKPVLKFDTTEITLSEDGGIAEIGYTIENGTGEETPVLEVAYTADWLTVESTSSAVKFTAVENDTNAGRVANVAISYKDSEKVTIVVKQPNIEVPTENLTLELTLKEAGPTSITLDIKASNEKMTWIPMVTYKEYWDEKLSDEEIFISDLAYFEYLAENYGISLEEFLDEMLGKGSQQDIVIENLTPETEFVVYAYGLTNDGRRTTDIVAVEVTTAKPYEGDITFEFDFTVEDYIMEFSVIPSHLGVNYYHGIATETEIEEWKKLAESDNLRDAIQYSIEEGIEMYMNYDFIDDRKDYFDMCNAYDIVDDGWERIKADTKYILYACKWNEECNLIGEVSTKEYTSPAAAMSDNKLSVEVKEITQSQVTISVTTTNYDPYVIMPMKSEDIADMSDSEIYSFVTTKYDYLVSEYTFQGDMTRILSHMRPDTDYTILVFGSLAGTMTTEMIKVEVHTIPSGDPKDCTFTFNVMPGADNAWLEIDPSDKGHYYNWMIYPADYTAEEAKTYIKDVILGKYYEGDIPAFSSWELTQGYINTTAWDLHPETDYKVGVIIMDYDTAEFLTEMTFSEVFTTQAIEFADISISVSWDKYWDGEALFDYGYTQFEGCDNEAVIPMSVNIEGDYDEFYWAIYNRDLTDEETLPDDMFYEDLNYGYTMKSIILSVPFDTTMTIVAVAYDSMFTPSRLYREAIHLTKDGASPVEEFAEIGGAPLKAATRSMVYAANDEVVIAERKQHHSIELTMADRAEIEEARIAKLKSEVESLNRQKPTKFMAR